MKKIIRLSSLFLFLILSQSSWSSWKGLPVIANSPETGLQYGALLLQSLDEEAVDGKLSSIQYVAINSTEHQQRLVVRPTLYFFDYKLLLEPVINYSSFPEYFYGFGNDTSIKDEEGFTSEYLYLEMTAYYNIHSNFNLLFLTSSDDREITEYESGKLIDTLLTSSSESGKYKLISKGLGLVWDTRDIPRYPNKGVYAEISRENYQGGIYDYDQNTVDLRIFHDLGNNQVIGAQAIKMTQDGYIPFINLNTIGGTDVVRGIFEGRYRAPDMQALQIEYRKHGYHVLDQELGFTVFAATGKVEGLTAIEDDSYHSAVGVGGHFFFNPEDSTTIRIDLAYGDGELGVYLMIDQAF